MNSTTKTPRGAALSRKVVAALAAAGLAFGLAACQTPAHVATGSHEHVVQTPGVDPRLPSDRMDEQIHRNAAAVPPRMRME
jgi:hypothetical protein